MRHPSLSKALLGILISVLLPTHILHALDPSIIEVREERLPAVEESSRERIVSQANEQNALLFLEGESEVTREDTTTLRVIVDPSGSEINTVSMHIAYESDMLDFVGVENSSSTFAFSFLEDHDSQVGIIAVHYLQPFPGISEESVVMDLVFQPKQANTTAVVSFLPKTRVLASDGYGTDVLLATGFHRFTIK